MIDEIKTLVESRNALALQAHEQYKLVVNNIIETKCKDVNHISLTLDYMLDFCFDDQMLILYRRLCSYLSTLNEQAAVSYVNDYRQMWDEEGTQFGNKKRQNGK